MNSIEPNTTSVAAMLILGKGKNQEVAVTTLAGETVDMKVNCAPYMYWNLEKSAAGDYYYLWHDARPNTRYKVYLYEPGSEREHWLKRDLQTPPPFERYLTAKEKEGRKLSRAQLDIASVLSHTNNQTYARAVKAYELLGMCLVDLPCQQDYLAWRLKYMNKLGGWADARPPKELITYWHMHMDAEVLPELHGMLDIAYNDIKKDL